MFLQMFTVVYGKQKMRQAPHITQKQLFYNFFDLSDNYCRLQDLFTDFFSKQPPERASGMRHFEEMPLLTTIAKACSHQSLA